MPEAAEKSFCTLEWCHKVNAKNKQAAAGASAAQTGLIPNHAGLLSEMDSIIRRRNLGVIATSGTRAEAERKTTEI